MVNSPLGPQHGHLSDAELLVASVHDASCFRALYDRWVDPMAAYFFRRTWDAEATSDLVAETFSVAWLKRRQFRPGNQPGASWLFGIARRELAMYRRRARVRNRALRRLGVAVPSINEGSMADVDERIDAERYRDALEEALSRLSRGQRAALALRVIDDLPYREVAAKLGCSEAAARVRVHRALARLAELLEAPAT